MSHFETPYIELLQKILREGEERKDRTGVGTLSIFGGQLTFDLRDALPVVTIKKTLWKSAFIEMLWFLRGESNTNFLKEYNIPIWDDWADENGNLGPIYGVQWRKWPGKVKIADTVPEGNHLYSTQEIISFQDHSACCVYQEHLDQVTALIEGIKKNPNGRRHIVTAWNPTYLSEMGLPPCHRDFQCYVSNDGHIDLMMAIRSWDTALGGPFNIAQYALLTHLIGRATGLKPRYLKINYGDAHLYLNHVEPIREMIQTRAPIECKPTLLVNTDNTDIDGYKPEDFDIVGYEFNPFIKLPIAV
jgi:thymidylate synthase